MFEFTAVGGIPRVDHCEWTDLIVVMPKGDGNLRVCSHYV